MTQITLKDTPSRETLVIDVLEAIEDQTGINPIGADPPLEEVINTDALCELFASTANGDARSGGQVTFSYQGCTIVLDFDAHSDNTRIRVIDRNP